MRCMPGKLNEKGEIASSVVHLSLARRCGDFVFTSAVGPWGFDPSKAKYDAAGNLIDDGTGKVGVPFADQVHMTIANLNAVLESEGATLDDVVDCQVWLASPATFLTFNEIYRSHFTAKPPVRSVFPQQFMFFCGIEMKAIAYAPLAK
jgi:enamine deaminase RidA (YjgF/YER057c/UK114 family)